MNMHDPWLSVIIRIHDARLLKRLDEAVFSAAIQRYHPVQVVVAIQGDSPDAQSVEALLAAQPFTAEEHRAHRVVVVPNPEKRDLRARLLNCGLEAAIGRYVAFLDADDVVYQHAWSILVDKLVKTDAGLAAGSIVKAEIRCIESESGVLDYVGTKRPWFESEPVPIQRDLMDGNFLPLHAFVIDRSRAKLPAFDERLSRLEDYDFLLRLGAQVRFDLSAIGVPVGEYRLRDDGHNVNPLANGDADNLRQWDEARAHVADVKASIAEHYARWPARPVAAEPVVTTGHMLKAFVTVWRHVGGWRGVRRVVAAEWRARGFSGVLSQARRVARRQ
jgi:glycosyltransferase involved in cell wall biosynthesis